jgi:hypothetical protein
MYRRDGEDFLARVRTVPFLVDERVECFIVFIQEPEPGGGISHPEPAVGAARLDGRVAPFLLTRCAIQLTTSVPDSRRWSIPCRKIIRTGKFSAAAARLRQAGGIDGIHPHFHPTVEYKMEGIDLKTALPRLLDRWRPHMVRVNIQYNVQIDPATPSGPG